MAAERERLRELPADVDSLWRRHHRRIGVVLSGGGARGSYEAGVLLAFGDARLPTHVISAASIGSINAASFAANADGNVGNAGPLVDSWSELTPATVGIEWFRYIFVLTGLIAASAGFGNLLLAWLDVHRIVFLHTQYPGLAWLAFGIAGAAFVFFHDELSYLAYVVRHRLKQRAWRPDRQRLRRSLLSNALVWGCVFGFLAVAHPHLLARHTFDEDSHSATFMLIGALTWIALLGIIFRDQVSLISHRFLRVPMRSGLFANFERTRFLRSRIANEKLRASPIHVVFAATEVRSGVECFFSNHTREALKQDARVDPDFADAEVVETDDTMLAVIASSAFSMVYETVPIGGGVYTDGGIVANQPIRPAVRMGAEVLFLVMVEPRSNAKHEVKTFLDVGIRALDILMAQNLKADLKTLSTINAQCEFHAGKLGIRPEQIHMKNGARAFQYLKTIVVAPENDIALTPLDFRGDLIAPAIVQGYRDGISAVLEFAEYLRNLPAELPRVSVELSAGRAAAAAK